MNEKVLKVIEAAKSRLGNPYVFGMWGRQCTPSVRRQYAGYNPSHKRACTCYESTRSEYKKRCSSSQNL